MNEELRKTLEKLRTKNVPSSVMRTPPKDVPKIDMELYRQVEKVRPGLILELANKLDVTRNAVYKMLRPSYGGNRQSWKTIQRFNELLHSIKEEVRNSLDQ